LIALIQNGLLWLLVWLGLVERPDFHYRSVTDHPSTDSIVPGVIYVLGGPGYQKWAYFRCPAKADEIIQLSLMPGHRPRWEVRTDWLNRPTIHPSLRQLEGSYAHFWVKRGRIEWCPDSGRPAQRSHR
jgi:hypothetical protein